MADQKYYVYALLDPRKPGKYSYKVSFGVIQLEFEPFYIGKGCRSRLRKHVADVRRNFDVAFRDYKQRKIRKILAEGLVPVEMKISTGLIEDVAFSREMELIGVIRATNSGGPLTNMTRGGEGASCFEFSEERRAKLRGPRSEEAKARMREGCKYRIPHKHTPESIEKIRAAVTGRKMPNSAVQKLIERNTGRVMSSESREKNRLSNLGKTHSKEAREKMSLARKGVAKSPEHIENQAAAQRGKPRPKTKCPHCPVVSSHGNIARWHGDNCKARNKE